MVVITEPKVQKMIIQQDQEQRSQATKLTQILVFPAGTGGRARGTDTGKRHLNMLVGSVTNCKYAIVNYELWRPQIDSVLLFFSIVTDAISFDRDFDLN